MPSFEMDVIKAAVTLGTVNTVIPNSAFVAAIGLHNSDAVNDITVTPSDGNGKILGATVVPAGQTVWLDFAKICQSKGFYFENGFRLAASIAAKVYAWPSGYEAQNIIPPFNTEIVKAALTLGLSTVMVPRDCLIAGIGLYNSHNAVVTVTPKDANARILAPTAIDPGKTAYLDFANISRMLVLGESPRGRGFFFSGGLTLTADVAAKVDAWISGATQV